MNVQKKLARSMSNNVGLINEYWSLKKLIENSEPSLARMVIEERFAELKKILKF